MTKDKILEVGNRFKNKPLDDLYSKIGCMLHEFESFNNLDETHDLRILTLYDCTLSYSDTITEFHERVDEDINNGEYEFEPDDPFKFACISVNMQECNDMRKNENNHKCCAMISFYKNYYHPDDIDAMLKQLKIFCKEFSLKVKMADDDDRFLEISAI